MSTISHCHPLVNATVDQAGGSRIARHWHEQHQVAYPSVGVVAVTAGGGSWIAPSDRAIWIPAGCLHEHRFYGQTKFHCVGFDVSENPLNLVEPSVVAVTPLLRELLIACSDPDAHPADEYARLRAVLADQLRRSPERPLHLPAAKDERLAAACELVEHDLAHGWTLAELGRRVGASERTLTRLFRSDIGMTYPQWRTQLRLYRALQLLAEDTPVTTVAHRTGWSSTSAFIDVYRRAFGHTPGAYSNRLGISP